MRQTLTALRQTIRTQLREWAHVTHNAGWLVAERVLRLVIGVVVSVAVARHLGPSGMGELGLALGWAALAAPLATLCLDDLVIRELVAQTERRGEVLGTALALRLIAAAGCMALAPLTMWLLYRDVGRVELVFVVTLTALWGAGDVFTLWFHHKTQMRDHFFDLGVRSFDARRVRGLLVVVCRARCSRNGSVCVRRLGVVPGRFIAPTTLCVFARVGVYVCASRLAPGVVWACGGYLSASRSGVVATLGW
jgi:hypothetical protein